MLFGTTESAELLDWDRPSKFEAFFGNKNNIRTQGHKINPSCPLIEIEGRICKAQSNESKLLRSSKVWKKDMTQDSDDENEMDVICNCGHRRWEHSRDGEIGQGKCSSCSCEQFHSI